MPPSSTRVAAPALAVVANKVSFPEQELEILAFWKKHDIFKKSLAARAHNKRYVFYDGPPFATGLPHYGHLLAGIIKDIVPRYFAMQGNYVERRFGWDCHGLPVEMEIQKKLELKTSKAIQHYGIANFNQACKNIVLRYTEQWQNIVERIGRWVDFSHDYKTMDRAFMESIWWVFKQIYDQGLIYKGFKVVPYSWKATTILSNFEANLNYHSVQDPSIIVKFRRLVGSANEKNIATQASAEYFLAWTTTPWTLIANLALAVNPQLTYVKILYRTTAGNAGNEIYILAKGCLEKTFTATELKENISIIEEITGKELHGERYQPIFPYAKADLTGDSKLANAFQVLADEFVGAEEGVGIVHIAPAYGEEDFRLSHLHGLPHYDPIDTDGFFHAQLHTLAKLHFKTADKTIIKMLKTEQKLLRHTTIAHSYPFCWRTDTPLMYKAISTWFVKVETIKEQLVANNEEIRWVPAHIKHGRFGGWLRDAKDWAISRNRYWGTPLPIWEAENGERLCFGSIAELEQAYGKPIGDLHKPGIDEIVIHRHGQAYRRVPEVLDCWFESGSMPYAHKHYPFEDKATFEANFPADFIAEGLDQTRGWFYTLLVIATCLMKQSSFKNVIVNGLILAEDGKKMSKRLKNYPDPSKVLEKLGADALRAYLISSQVLKGETLRFSEQGIVQTMRTLMIPLWNALAFLTTYANLDGWKPCSEPSSWQTLDPATLHHPLDKWLLASKETLLTSITAAMHAYKLYKAVPPLSEFTDQLTNIYIRRSRERFWRSRHEHAYQQDKDSAYRTLYSVLKHFAIILAPFMPFLAEKIYQTLRNNHDPLSVHLENYPKPQKSARNPQLEAEFATVNQLIALGRSARIAAKIRTRQPVAQLTILTQRTDIPQLLAAKYYYAMIREEINVKKVVVSTQETDYMTYSAKANFKTLGKHYGNKVKAIHSALTKLSSATIAGYLAKKTFNLTLAETGETISLPATAVLIQRTPQANLTVHTQGTVSGFIQTALSPQLLEEGLVREFIHAVQTIRKEHHLPYDAKITLHVRTTPQLQTAILAYESTIKKQTLALTIHVEALQQDPQNTPSGAKALAAPQLLQLLGNALEITVTPIQPSKN